MCKVNKAKNKSMHEETNETERKNITHKTKTETKEIDMDVDMRWASYIN